MTARRDGARLAVIDLQHSRGMMPLVIELLGVGVPRGGGGWLLHRVCSRIEPGQLTIVLSAAPEERHALLDAVTGRVIPEEGRVWVGRRPLTRETVSSVRAHVVEADLATPMAAHRSLAWNALAPRVVDRLMGVLRVPRRPHRMAALTALAQVGLEGAAYQPASVLDREGRVRLALARALSRSPEWIAVRDLDLALERESTDRVLALLGRLVRQRRAGVLASLVSPSPAIDLADRVIVLTEGLLTFDGSPNRFQTRSTGLERREG